MKYKVLKTFTTITRTLESGDEVNWADKTIPVRLKDGFLIAQKELIEQGFIEEVKETPSKNWRIGDKVVIELAGWDKRYGKIDGIMGDNYIACGGENWMVEKFREPTHEENARYFN